MKKEIWKIAVVVYLLTVTFIVLWMNRYEYQHAGPNQILVRINRFTGQECYLKSTGWDSRINTPAQKTDAETGAKDSLAEYVSSLASDQNKCESGK